MWCRRRRYSSSPDCLLVCLEGASCVTRPLGSITHSLKSFSPVPSNHLGHSSRVLYLAPPLLPFAASHKLSPVWPTNQPTNRLAGWLSKRPLPFSKLIGLASHPDDKSVNFAQFLVSRCRILSRCPPLYLAPAALLWPRPSFLANRACSYSLQCDAYLRELAGNAKTAALPACTHRSWY